MRQVTSDKLLDEGNETIMRSLNSIDSMLNTILR